MTSKTISTGARACVNPPAWFEHVKIRQVIQADLPALEWDGEYSHFRRVYAEAFTRARNGLAVLWVSELPGAGLIGQVFIQLECSRKELADGCTRAYLYGFRVRPEYRGRGLGSRMLAIVEEDLRRRGFIYLTLNVAKDNPRAAQLYETHGYVVTAPEPGIWKYPDEKGVIHEVVEPAWRMEKRLV